MNIIKSGKLRGEKVRYQDGVGCSVWYPFEEEGDGQDAGICFDFSLEDIDDFILLLEKIKSAKEEVFEE